jgi:hypothetical protein
MVFFAAGAAAAMVYEKALRVGRGTAIALGS